MAGFPASYRRVSLCWVFASGCLVSGCLHRIRLITSRWRSKALSFLQVGGNPTVWCVVPHAGAMGVSRTRNSNMYTYIYTHTHILIYTHEYNVISTPRLAQRSPCFLNCWRTCRTAAMFIVWLQELWKMYCVLLMLVITRFNFFPWDMNHSCLFETLASSNEAVGSKHVVCLYLFHSFIHFKEHSTWIYRTRWKIEHQVITILSACYWFYYLIWSGEPPIGAFFQAIYHPQSLQRS